MNKMVLLQKMWRGTGRMELHGRGSAAVSATPHQLREIAVRAAQKLVSGPDNPVNVGAEAGSGVQLVSGAWWGEENGVARRASARCISDEAHVVLRGGGVVGVGVARSGWLFGSK